ncbi:hypothetical protein QYF61_004203 [Mycteria americana]|uniref:Uncharacterized protein n=1 Tax=Mycteria americana TaxID=33587 RepID=A0AAN7P6W9_MYCAM|nr:hypothetical protein QYF61_004203 [Mycteria americana]
MDKPFHVIGRHWELRISQLSLKLMKRASSLNVLNMGGKATEDHFQERNNCLTDSRVLSVSHTDLAH